MFLHIILRLKEPKVKMKKFKGLKLKKFCKEAKTKVDIFIGNKNIFNPYIN